MIKVQIGDILESPMQSKVNTVNCIGIMGKGIAREFKKLYPEMFEDYEQRCKAHEVKPGVPYLYEDLFGDKIINFPTKDHWKALSKIEHIIQGLDLFIEHYKEWGIESVAFPPLGCGNGGLEWAVVGPIMYQKLSKLDIDVEIYAPFSTNPEHLKPEFLLKNNEVSPIAKAPVTVYPPGWIAVLEILYRLEQMQYTNYVGRIVLQKICYVVTMQGLTTGFAFKQSSYGPFSSQVYEMYKAFGNANLISEQQIGSLLWIRTGSEYTSFRKKVLPRIESQIDAIEKTVDLFSRIKSATQAEEMATILYAYEDISSNSVNDMTTEQEFFNYIIKWKKHWDKPEKLQSIASTIRNLAVLGWITLDYSETLPVDEEESDRSD